MAAPPTPRATGANSIRGQLILVGLTAVLFTLAFAPFGLASLAWICLVPALIAALRTSYLGRLAWVSYVVGLVWWLAMIRWMIPVTFGGYLALSAYMAVYWPAGLLLIRHLHRSYPRLPLMLTVPCVWVSLELIRDLVLAGGFGWYNLAHAMGTYEPDQTVSKIIQVADLFGEWGVSFILAMTSGFVLDLLTQPWVKPQPDGTRLAARKLRLTVLSWSLIVGIAWCYGYYRVSDTENHLRPGPNVAIIQTNVPQDNKDSPSTEQRISDWQRLLGMSVEVTYNKPKPDLILWPETATPAAINREAIDHYLEVGSGWEQIDSELQQITHTLKTPILAGGPENADFRLVEDGQGSSYYVPAMRRNTAYLYDAQGVQWPETYSKIHRVPFGEFIPWVEWSPWLKQQFINYLSPYPFDYTLKPGDGVVYFPVPFDRDGAAAGGTASTLAALDQPMPDSADSSAAASEATGASELNTPTPPAEDAPPVVDEAAAEDADASDDVPNAGPVASPTSSDEPGAAGPVAFAITPICFEDTVARLVRNMVYRDGEKKADLILNLTNDGWFEHTWQPWHHTQIATFRSIEHRIPSARAVNTGVSSFVDSAGRVVAMVEEDGEHASVEGWAVREMQLDDRVTLFSRIGEWPARLLAIMTALAAALGLVWPKRMAEPKDSSAETSKSRKTASGGTNG